MKIFRLGAHHIPMIPSRSARHPPKEGHRPGEHSRYLGVVVSVNVIIRATVRPDGGRKTKLEPRVVRAADILFDIEGLHAAIDDGFDKLQRVLDLRLFREQH